jgi:hypothetical protein
MDLDGVRIDYVLGDGRKALVKAIDEAGFSQNYINLILSGFGRSSSGNYQTDITLALLDTNNAVVQSFTLASQAIATFSGSYDVSGLSNASGTVFSSVEINFADTLSGIGLDPSGLTPYLEPGIYDVSVSAPSAIPLPASSFLLLAGMGALAAIRRAGR